MNIWKIATRWSDKGGKNSSIIDIFRKYNILFAGRKHKKNKELYDRYNEDYSVSSKFSINAKTCTLKSA